MPSVILVGLGPTAHTALESLAARLAVLAVVRPPSASDDPVSALAARLDVPVAADATPRGLRALIEARRPDGVVVSSYDRILKPELLALARFVNVHYAPLPRYRGRATINWAILNGEPEAAITIHTIAPGLDAGNILYQAATPIGPHDTVTELYERLNALQQEHLAEVVLRHLAGDAGRAQDEAAASYGCSRVPDDGEIDWNEPTERIYRLYRALTPPFPGAYTFLGEQRLTLGEARPVESPPRYVGRVPGRVAAIDRASGAIDVLTGDGMLRIASFRDDDELLPAAAVVTSVRATFGLRPRDLLARIAALEREVAALRSTSAVGRANGNGGVQAPAMTKRATRQSVGS